MRQMKKGAGVSIFIVLLLIVAAMCYLTFRIFAASSSVKTEDGLSGIKLGLDLQGGVSITYGVVGETPTPEEMADTLNKLRRRIENDLSESSTTTESNIRNSTDNRRIFVEIPGVHDANALLAELGTPGQLYFIIEKDEAGNENYSWDGTIGQYTLNYELEDLIENGSVVITGTDVVSSRAGYNEDRNTGNREPVVELSLSTDGAESFATATTRAYANNETIGIYYDGEFISVPRVENAITNGQAVINGMADFQEAESLASYIRIGGLTVQLEELQSEVVGAQLGSNAVSTSLLAGAIGILLVILFMLILYRMLGLAASISLILYTTIVIGLLNAFGVTLTLPGIAGIILSIGMAVDANVIIFARIREEVGLGKSARAAVDIGYKKALSAILDGNITTLIAAAVLGFIGSGSVQGFAITLAIGVIVSMFTALAITRLILACFVAMGVKGEKALGKSVRKSHFDFIKRKVVFFVISLVIICAGFAGMGGNAGAGRGALDLSLEFQGGTSTTVSFDEDYSIEELENEVVPVVSTITGDNDIQIQKVQGSNDVIIRTRTLELEKREALNVALYENFGVEDTAISSESIGSTISGEMGRQSIIAIIVAVALMLIYITIRFRDVRFAAAAVVALAHDVLIVLAIYALARITVGSAFIACMLTVIGYSINDTIVVFDRIRENIKSGVTDQVTLKEIANASVNQTLTRSISTSITTALTVIMLLILGVSSIREFALPLLVGVIAGTYSSIFLATPLWFLMRKGSIGKGKTDKPDKADMPGKRKRKEQSQKATKENQGILV